MTLIEFSRDPIESDGYYEFRRVDRQQISWILWVFVDPLLGPVVNADAVDLQQVPLFGLIGWEWTGPVEQELPIEWPEKGEA